jgi:hypothetical protein
VSAPQIDAGIGALGDHELEVHNEIPEGALGDKVGAGPVCSEVVEEHSILHFPGVVLFHRTMVTPSAQVLAVKKRMKLLLTGRGRKAHRRETKEDNEEESLHSVEE